MKRKRLNDVYMREVIDSKIKTIKNEELNCYMTYKHIIKTSKKCTVLANNKKIILVDNGYTIFEYSPIDKPYNVRLFIDDKDDILLYYFDMINKSYYIDGEIYYDDLYLDIEMYTDSNLISLVDEDDLKNALKQGLITKEEFDESYKTSSLLIKELEDNSNIFINRGIKDYLNMKEE